MRDEQGIDQMKADIGPDHQAQLLNPFTRMRQKRGQRQRTAQRACIAREHEDQRRIRIPDRGQPDQVGYIIESQPKTRTGRVTGVDQHAQQEQQQAVEPKKKRPSGGRGVLGE